MKLTFTCNSCNKRKFFSSSHKGICTECYNKEQEIVKQKENEKEEVIRKQKEQERLNQKAKEREQNKKLANEKLRKELEKERVKEILKEQKAKQEKEKKLRKKNQKAKLRRLKREQIQSEKEESINLLKEAEELSTQNETVLYVSATVKRLKVIEWRNGKKKILLNKEREIRKTHKGGWSQEKFQRFVKSQKNKSLEWIESNLMKEGVLRPPYQKVMIQAKDESIKEMLVSVLKEEAENK